MQELPERKPATSAERGANHSRLRNARVRQADIEAQKNVLLQQLQNLEFESKALQVECKQLQDRLTETSSDSINVLPEELLFMVFEEYVCQGDMPEALLLVSRRWYHAALAVKGIWASLKVPSTHRYPSYAPRFIDRRLILSGPAPIELDLDDLGVHFPLQLQAWHPTPIIISGKHCHRIRRLTVNHQEDLALFDSPMPLLEHLTYGPISLLQVQSIGVAMKKQDWKLDPSTLPNLRSVHFRFLTFVSPPPILAALHTLVISTCPLTFDAAAFQSYIAAATSLRTLSLEYKANPRSAHGPDPSEVAHSSMTAFHYTDSSVFSTRCLVNRLNLPAATDIGLAMHELAQITGLLEGSLGEVVQLRLGAASPCTIEDLVDLLKHATKLQNLELTMGCVTLTDCLMEHLERGDGLCPRLSLIEPLQPSREFGDRLERRHNRLNQ